MNMVLTYPDFTLGSYFTTTQVNGKWVVNFIWGAHQSMPFDMSEVRKISDIIITRVHIKGHYSAQPNGDYAKVGMMSTPIADRAFVPIGGDFDVDLSTDIGTTGTYDVVASYVTKVRAVENGTPIPGYQYLNGRYYTFVAVSSVSLIVEYQSATTACTGPTSVSLNKSVAESFAILSWSGAQGGTNNAIDHYDIQCKDLPDGSWVDLGSAPSLNYVVAPNPNPGGYRQFRVRAVGAAGDAYASDWVVCEDLLRKNIAPGKPGAIVPAMIIVEADAVNISWGAASPGLSSIASYRVEGCVEDGEWVLINAAVSGLSCSASMLNAERGQTVYFRVRAIDSEGGVSGWTFSDGVRKNRVPLKPTVLWPASGATCLAEKPIVGMSIPADPDGQPMTVQVRVGTGNWKNAGAVPAGGSKQFVFRLPAAIDQSETATATSLLPFVLPSILGEVVGTVVYFRVIDSLGAGSEYTFVIANRVSYTWNRIIRRGTVIANDNLSHQADLQELLQVVNGRLSWFKRPTITYDLEVGWFAHWLPQMQQLYNALVPLFATNGEEVDELQQVGNAPTADTINLVRRLCKQL